MLRMRSWRAAEVGRNLAHGAQSVIGLQVTTWSSHFFLQICGLARLIEKQALFREAFIPFCHIIGRIAHCWECLPKILVSHTQNVHLRIVQFGVTVAAYTSPVFSADFLAHLWGTFLRKFTMENGADTILIDTYDGQATCSTPIEKDVHGSLWLMRRDMENLNPVSKVRRHT